MISYLKIYDYDLVFNEKNQQTLLNTSFKEEIVMVTWNNLSRYILCNVNIFAEQEMVSIIAQKRSPFYSVVWAFVSYLSFRKSVKKKKIVSKTMKMTKYNWNLWDIWHKFWLLKFN